MATMTNKFQFSGGSSYLCQAYYNALLPKISNNGLNILINRLILETLFSSQSWAFDYLQLLILYRHVLLFLVKTGMDFRNRYEKNTYQK